MPSTFQHLGTHTHVLTGATETTVPTCFCLRGWCAGDSFESYAAPLDSMDTDGDVETGEYRLLRVRRGLCPVALVRNVAQAAFSLRTSLGLGFFGAVLLQAWRIFGKPAFRTSGARAT